MYIDFSCKHDILIRHKDGTLTPMDQPYYEPQKIGENTWQIMSSGDYHYLVAGDEEGIAIDTGYAAGNLREYLEGLCGKPVPCAVNTHSHFDHSANNPYFDKAYISAADEPNACQVSSYPSFAGIDFPRDYESVIVGDGSIIPLKGRELEIFEIGDHTEGGIAILDRKERILFTGDEIMPMGKRIALGVERFAESMDKIHAVRGDYDRVCAGGGIFDASVIDEFWEAAHMILEGKKTGILNGPVGPTGRVMGGGPKPGPGGEHKPGPDGEHKPGQGGGHGPEQEYVDGHKVYDCQHPHKEDMPAGKPGGQGGAPAFAYLEYKGHSFAFPEK